MADSYDSASLTVEPQDICDSATALVRHSDEVAASLTRISNTVTALELGWAGKSADEAQQFNERWDHVMGELFGPRDHPEQGVLNVMAGGIKAAAVGFSQTEVALEQVFKKFAEGLSGDGSSSGTPGSVPDRGDSDHSAVIEDFPN
jgi:uncharacterized protein YukE